MGVILYLIFSVAPKHGNSNIFVYLAICSLIGSLSVMSVKASLLDFRLPKHMKLQAALYQSTSYSAIDCGLIEVTAAGVSMVWCAGAWHSPQAYLSG